MNIKSRKKGQICILDISGEIKTPKGDVMLRQSFDELLENGERQFVFDMLDVRWLDTSGIAETIACHKKVLDKQGVVKLIAKEKALELYVLYRLQTVFEIYGDLEEALASFAT